MTQKILTRVEKIVAEIEHAFKDELAQAKGYTAIIEQYGGDFDAAKTKVVDSESRVGLMNERLRDALMTSEADKVKTAKDTLLSEQNTLRGLKVELAAYEPKHIEEAQTNMRHLQDSLGTGLAGKFFELVTSQVQKTILSELVRIFNRNINNKALAQEVSQIIAEKYSVNLDCDFATRLRFSGGFSIIAELLQNKQLGAKINAKG